MTPERIAELRALCDKATPGPWSFYYDAGPDGGVISICEQREGGLVIADLSGGPADTDDDNAAFIEAARTALPEALDAIERVRAMHKSDEAERSHCNRCRFLWPCPTIIALEGRRDA